ncbi:MAG: hypothetical protein KXJ61_12135 [Hydrogenophaga sp.]|uniref:hypothetical protein n=1 Tax=Hydrogenophaga sp. TaxID=1904254 RepID=UPI001DD4E7A4|nr:hypothetical protein [Hydrogenophaga sp.]MBW0170966.1 hypothetical protein [Hydrogenophaga sp.]MBW0185053.1 hypothetical protein [Hydrogenophaga sp.]
MLILVAKLAACADVPLLKQLGDEVGMSAQPSEEYLAERCSGGRANARWAQHCRQWMNAREAEQEAKRQSEVAAREAARAAEAAAYQEQQERRQREAAGRERAAVQADEREGYKHLSFEDFALDAARMQGAKVALYGIYVGKGQRLASNQFAALMWIERGQSTKGALMPLVTTDATRDSRAMLLRCDASPVGCVVVVRGRVRMLSMRNAFGADSRELGVVVESVR